MDLLPDYPDRLPVIEATPAPAAVEDPDNPGSFMPLNPRLVGRCRALSPRELLELSSVEAIQGGRGWQRREAASRLSRKERMSRQVSSEQVRIPLSKSEV
jgi:hypothetical protein